MAGAVEGGVQFRGTLTAHHSVIIHLGDII